MSSGQRRVVRPPSEGKHRSKQPRDNADRSTADGKDRKMDRLKGESSRKVSDAEVPKKTTPKGQDGKTRLQVDNGVTSTHRRNKSPSLNGGIDTRDIESSRRQEGANRKSETKQRESEKKHGDRDRPSGEKHSDRNSEGKHRDRESGGKPKERESEKKHGDRDSGEKYRDKKSDGKHHRDRESGGKPKERESEKKHGDSASGEKHRDRKSDGKHRDRESGGKPKEIESVKKHGGRDIGGKHRETGSGRKHGDREDDKKYLDIDYDGQDRASNRSNRSSGKSRKAKELHESSDTERLRGNERLETNEPIGIRVGIRPVVEIMEDDVIGSAQGIPNYNHKQSNIQDNSETDEYDYGESDFEAYNDDDFDEESDDNDKVVEKSLPQLTGDPEIDTVIMAMYTENLKLASKTSDASVTEKSIDGVEGVDKSASRTSQYKGINFLAVKQRAAERFVKSRHVELHKLVEFDHVTLEWFEMAPLSEYDMYIRSFGRMNTSQVSVQTGESDIGRECQTEETDSRDSWTQHPVDDGMASWTESDEFTELAGSTQRSYIDPRRLTNFINKVSQVVIAILEEVSSSSGSLEKKRSRTHVEFSEGFFAVDTGLSFLSDRKITCVASCISQNQFIAVAYSCVEKSRSRLADNGLILVWNVNLPSQPHRILIAQSEVTTCSFSPIGSTLVFAGTVDGSLLLWDLREGPTAHSRLSMDGSDWVFRGPTYSTEYLLPDEKHTTRLVAVQPVFQSSHISGANNNNLDFSSFQLASLDEGCRLFFWVCIEFAKSNPAGLESEPGLIPGGRVKLVRSSELLLGPGPVTAVALDYCRQDPNHVYVATDTGSVLHATRYASTVFPRSHHPRSPDPTPISAVSFHPRFEVFLVAGRDGHIRLYNKSEQLPLASWLLSTDRLPVCKLGWSPSRPSVFYVLDSASRLHVWDLLRSDSGPLYAQHFSEFALVDFALTSDYAASGLGIQGRKAVMICCFANGAVEIHQLKRELRKTKPEEIQQFASYIECL